MRMRGLYLSLDLLGSQQEMLEAQALALVRHQGLGFWEPFNPILPTPRTQQKDSFPEACVAQHTRG